ncbi:MAG: hypothetical protein OHK0039_20520 [Bacteroidia bacterium]
MVFFAANIALRVGFSYRSGGTCPLPNKHDGAIESILVRMNRNIFAMPFHLLLLLLFAVLPSDLHAQVVLAADFEQGLSTGWGRSQAAGSAGWVVGDSAANSQGFWVIPGRGHFAVSNDDACNCDMRRDYLFGPPLDLRAYKQLFLTFASFYDGVAGSRAWVVVRAGTHSDWTPVWQVPARSAWQIHTLDLSAWAGLAQVQIGFWHDDGGGWGSGWAVDDVRAYVPPDQDLALRRLFVEPVQAPGFVWIEALVANTGALPQAAWVLHYQIDQQPVQRQHMGRQVLRPLDSLRVLHPIPWTADSPGTHHTLRVFLTLADDQTDALPANDTLAMQLVMIDHHGPRQVLVEAFTQHNCAICAVYNPSLHDLLDAWRDRVAPVIYHASWPGPNDDPFHLFNPTDHLARIQAYDIDAIPRLYADGAIVRGGSYTGAPDGLTADGLLARSRQPLTETLHLDEYIAGGLLRVRATLHTLAGPRSPRTLYAAVVQDAVDFDSPSGENGETHFPHVLRFFLPNAQGAALPAMLPGDSLRVDLAYLAPPATAGGLQRVVVWVQEGAAGPVSAVAETDGFVLCSDGRLIDIGVSVGPAACDSTPSGSIQLAAGDSSFAVQWADGATGWTRTGLVPGRYMAWIGDTTGCTVAVPVVVQARPGPVAAAIVDDVRCPGGADGQIEVRGLLGQPPYHVSWSDGDSGLLRSGLAGGSYTGVLRDAAGCRTAVRATVAAPEPFRPDYRRQPSDSTANGRVEVLGQGGTAPYRFLWSDGAEGAQRDSLPVGAFQVVVEDEAGCTYGPLSEYIWATAIDVPTAPAIGVWYDGGAIWLRQPAAQRYSYRVFDMQGRTWMQGTAGPGDTLLPVPGWTAGIYLVQVQEAGRYAFHRLMIW